MKDDLTSITLRRCDIYSVLIMLSLGNKKAVQVACEQLELMKSNVMD